MEQKEAYIEYKNTVLMNLVNQSTDKQPVMESSSSLVDESEESWFIFNLLDYCSLIFIWEKIKKWTEKSQLKL